VFPWAQIDVSSYRLVNDRNTRTATWNQLLSIIVVFGYASVTRTKSTHVGMPNKEQHAPSESLDMLLQLEISCYDKGFMVFLSSPHEGSETSHHRYLRNLHLFTSHDNFNIIFVTIQGDSGQKVNILEGDSIGHGGKKFIRTCLIQNGYRDTAVWLYQYKTIVNGNKEWEITYC
jgi:hypothetical protein